MDATKEAGIDTISVTHFHEYLEMVDYAQKNLLKRNNDDIVIYRGQSVDKNLYPRIGRSGYSHPNRINFEKKIFLEFIRLSYPHLQGGSLNDWDYLAIAQHYFLPTRLLDWSGNPLVALWFAISDQSVPKPDRVVWCYSFKQEDIVNSETGDPFSQVKTMVYRPKHISNRIVTQNGWFTSHYCQKDNNHYTALNRMKDSPPKLTKIKLSIDEKEDRMTLLNSLDSCGVNSYSIFNDLEGLCKYLDWRTFKK